MKAAVAVKAGMPFRIEDRPAPQPGPGQARVRVHACGICHSDQFVRDGLWPGLVLPRVPGHEVAGVVESTGAGVTHLKAGQRVGIGWTGGHCGVCEPCRSGDTTLCEVGTITGFSYDGGYQETMTAPAEALAPIPDALSFAEAAPLMCAGVTTFNALRNAGAPAGSLVAVHGLGGLGHLGVQFARALGYRVAAISRGRDKEELARSLGAHQYVDAAGGDAAAALRALGGARVILATAPHAASIGPLTGGLSRNGRLLIVAAPHEPLSISALDLIGRRATVAGWPSGHAQDSAETLAFAALHRIRPMIESFPLERANDAYERMISGAARFRVVLTPTA